MILFIEIGRLYLVDGYNFLLILVKIFLFFVNLFFLGILIFFGIKNLNVSKCLRVIFYILFFKGKEFFFVGMKILIKF